MADAERMGISRTEYMAHLKRYQHSPELTACSRLEVDAIIPCSEEAAHKYGILPASGSSRPSGFTSGAPD
ncbi:MAG TPA: hypothetical protein PKD55_21795 [Bellilinea sp.]|nr:hypothetical protein [Bellilinea sp.]